MVIRAPSGGGWSPTPGCSLGGGWWVMGQLLTTVECPGRGGGPSQNFWGGTSEAGSVSKGRAAPVKLHPFF